ncbi:MAG: cupin domain-containing protein [Zoogloeaceae bacterium]|jgi:quercetin dioxygenase-like cupin family protein|nr:cupin domain-containing protein [Zoogloeaceae bacterium]
MSQAELCADAARTVALTLRQCLADCRAEREASGKADEAVDAELDNILSLLQGIDWQNADPTQLQASHHPVVEQLAGLAAPEGTALAALLPHLPALPWRYSYEARADQPDIGQRMAWAELVGPIAPFESHTVCLGLTAIGPGLRYPEHRHPAVETYLVLTGTARWTLDGDTRERPPGALILHPSNATHVMHTADDPLLAIYAWTGEVETLSSYVE